MTSYTVAIRGEDDASPQARSTDDVDDAVDWFTNAIDAVMDPEADANFASLTVDGKIWGVIQEGGLRPDGAEIIDIEQVRAA